MRYIANSSGYLLEVSFGADITCDGTDCVQYTGSVPSGYASLEAWYIEEGDKLYRWKIVNGNLTLDSGAAEPKDRKLYFKAGTKVITTTSSQQIAVFTSDELNELFGTSGITWDNSNSVCFFSNAEWAAQSIPICAMFYSGKWRMMASDWSNFGDGSAFRVNYLAVGWV